MPDTLTLSTADTLRIVDTWETLSPNDQARLRPQLRAFSDNPDNTRAIEAAGQARLAPLQNLEKHYLDGYDAYLESLPAHHRQQRQQVDALLGDGDDQHDRAANLMLMSQLMGQPPEKLTHAYEALLPQAYARLTGTIGPGDEASFTGAARQHFADIRSKRALFQSAGDAAGRAALTSDTWLPAYAEWQKQITDWDPVARQHEPETRQAFAAAFGHVSREIDYARPVVRRTLRRLREKYGVTEGGAPDVSLAEIANDIHTFAGEDPRTRRLLIAAVGALATEEGITGEDKGPGQNFGEALGRGTGDVIGGAGRFFGRQIANAGAATAGAIGADGLAEALEGTSTTMQIATDLRQVADGSVDPIAPLLEGWAGTVEKGLYAFGRSVPYTATVMLGPGGMATTTLGLAEGNAAQLRAQGATTGKADLVGLSAAVPEMLLERLQGKLATGATSQLLNRTARSLGMRGGTSIGARLGGEFLTEKAQDLVLPSVQSLAGAVMEDIPEVDWRDTFAQWTDLEANAELLVAVFPLSLIGAGGATYKEFKSGDQIFRDVDTLRLLGLPESTIAEAQAAKTPQEAQSIIRKAYPERDTTGTKERAEQYAQAARTSRDAIRQLEQLSAVPRITRTQDGEAFLVTDPETGDTFHAMTAGDAATIRAQVFQDRTGTTPEIAELAAYFQDRNADLTVEASPNSKSLQDAVSLGARNADTAYQRILLEEQATGIDFGKDLSAVHILGENVGEFRDNLYASTVRIYDGADILTVVEEKAETDARKWHDTGTVSYTQLRSLIQNYQDTTGTDLLKSETDEATIEAWSNLVKAAAIERSRDDFTPAKGFRAGLARLIRGYREYFRHVLSTARTLRRARKDGTLSEDLDLLLQQSLNIGEDATYQADTTRAAGELFPNRQDFDTKDPPPSTFSIGTTDVTPTRDTQTYPTDGGGVVGPASFNIRAHHGTPHKVDKFSTDNIGTGEGAQAYGWGLYFAQDEAVALFYRNKLSPPVGWHVKVKDQTLKAWILNARALYGGGDVQGLANTINQNANRILNDPNSSEKDQKWATTEKQLAGRMVEEAFLFLKKSGALYTVNIKAKPEELLDWDKPLSEQSKNVRRILRSMDFSESSILREMLDPMEERATTGRSIYARMSIDLKENVSHPDLGESPVKASIGDKGASKFLHSAGIKGIRYLDGDSRSDGEGTSNYVIFDGADIEILEENGQPVSTSPQPTFSIQPATIRRRLEAALTPALATPEARREAYENARRRLGDEAARWADAAVGRRTKKAIKAEAKIIEEEAHEKFLQANPTVLAHLEAPSILTSVMEQPTAGYLLGEIGKMESRSKAAARDSNSLDLYDDATYLPSYFWGGTTSPDDAAQQLHNAGLLNTNDVGEMWAKLDAEFSLTQRYKDKYREAKDIDRRARRDAKERAKAWTDSQLRAQGSLDRRALSRSLATLDTILAAFPPEVRARVGGYAALANLDSDEARLRYIEGRIRALDKELERYLHNEALADIAVLLQKARSKVKTEDRIKRSRLGPEADRQLDSIMGAISLDGEQADRRTAELEAAIADAQDDDAIASAVEDYTIHNLFSNLRDRTASELDTAYTYLKEIVETGRAITRVLEEENRLRRQKYRQDVSAQIYNPSQNTGQRKRDTAQESDDSRGGWFKRFLHDHLSIGQILDSLFYQNASRAPVAQEFTDRIRRATHAKTDAVLARRRRYKEALTRIFGTSSQLKQNRAVHRLQKRQETDIEFYEDRQSRLEKVEEDAADRIILGTLSDKRFKKNSQEFLALEAELQKNRALRSAGIKRKQDVAEGKVKGRRTGEQEKEFLEVRRITDPGTPTRQRLSQLEGVYYTMLAGQDSYKDILHAHGIDQTALDNIERWLTPEARAIRNYLATEYREGYDHLNPVYRSLYGTDMPRVDNYAPAHFEHAGQDKEIDMLNTGIASGGMGAGFVKSRRTHNAEPIKTDALAAYWAHAIQVEQFVHMTPVVNDLRATFLHPATKQEVKAAAGPNAARLLGTWIDTLANDGRHQAQLAAAVAKYVSRITSTLATVALGYKIGTVMKQASAMLGSVIEVPAKDLIRAIPGLFHGSGNLATIFRSSTIRRRIESGYSPEVRHALNASNSKPSVIFTLMEKGLLPIAWTDAALTSVGAALTYNHHLRKALASGLPEADAKAVALDRMDDVIARTAQPAETPDRSLAEIDATGAAKLLFMFRSEPRQKLAISYLAASLMLKGRMSKREAARRIFTAWILMPLVTETMGNLYLDTFTDLEDEEIWSAEDYAIAVALGPISGIFIAGSFIGALAAAYTDKKIYSEGNPIVESMKALADLWRWNKKDEGFLPWQQDTRRDQERAWTLYLKAFAQVIGGRAGVAGQATSIYKQFKGLLSNIVTPDDADHRSTR